MGNFLTYTVLAIVLSGGIRFIFLKKEETETPAEAIVMAAGIFIIASLPKLSWLVPYTKAFSALLFAVWFWIIVSLFKTVVGGTFTKRHVHHPLKRFAIGTWVAGTSVAMNVLGKYFSGIDLFLKVIAVLNLCLWVFYIIICIKVYIRMIKTDVNQKWHGVILLTTVSTQSLVLLFYNAYDGAVPKLVDAAMIGLGLTFYLLGFVLIAKRYIGHRGHWLITEEWMTTNCILHGAISITGLACVTTDALPMTLTWVLWIWVIVWLVLIESIEVARAIKRIQKYGWLKGIGTYDVTQWSRNFTFGMFYAFTTVFLNPGPAAFVRLRQEIIRYGYWVVLLFLVLELALFFMAKLTLPFPFVVRKHKGRVTSNQKN